MNEKERCFVMMPFTTPDSYEDVDHFNKIYEQIFVPAIKKAGYEPYRVDENKICDSIIGKIFEAVRTCPMALCDLSNKNPNVLYELGLRQAYDMPVVLVQDDITERIFDVSGISTVTYNNHRLVENVNEAIEAISDALIQTREGNENTLAKIVKAKSADFDSIEITGNDNINIMLNTILNDIKDIKKSNTNTNEQWYQTLPYLQYPGPTERKYVIKVKRGVTNTYINTTVNRCCYKFNAEVLKIEKKEDIVIIYLKHIDGSKTVSEIKQFLETHLGEKCEQ